MINAQTSLLDEIIVDNFAGGGGTSTGIELATGRTVTIAINHDPDAIAMHETNHPHTEHYQESVWDIDPEKVCAGRSVGLAWFSPDCKHFSKAKGGKPVDKRIRGLAWIVLRWAGTVRPRVIILENVEEFQSWGPVRRGRPVKGKAGQTFVKFTGQLQTLGYDVEWKELVAADYGTPTIRKRFFLVARCDGRPIVWPEPTHNRDGSDGKKKWRSAAEIIDWSLPCPSVFDSRETIREKYSLKAQRPLADNTLQRIIRGVNKFVLKNPQPFIVQVNHAGMFRGQSVDRPMQTVTAKHGYGVCEPSFARLDAALTMHNNENAVGTNLRDPLNTVRTGGGGGQMLIAPSLIQYHQEQREKVRGQAVSDPIMTIDGSNRYGLTAAHMTEYYGNADCGFPLTEPTHTATSKDRSGLTLAHLCKYYGGVVGSPADAPIGTTTAIDHNAVAATFVSKFYGTGTGQNTDEPLHTVTTSAGHFGAVKARLVKWDGRQSLYHWPEVRNLLNAHCDYHIADDEILLLEFAGTAWFISDIGLRMLTPRELYNANGFPPDYIIDRDARGCAYNKTKQVARCGNAVPPPFASALVAANLPEWCGARYATMAEFLNQVAV